jgi:hypothetical protein
MAQIAKGTLSDPDLDWGRRIEPAGLVGMYYVRMEDFDWGRIVAQMNAVTFLARRIYFVPGNRFDVDARMDAPVALGDPDLVTLDQIEGRADDSDEGFGWGLFETPQDMLDAIFERCALADNSRAVTRSA